jgi:hypothetical protein
VSTLGRLRELLAQEGGLIASLIAVEENGSARGLPGPAEGQAGAYHGRGSATEGSASPNGASGVAQLAASGPRAEGRGEQYELLIETIYEGYLLHYHAPRVVRAAEDDLGLLAGDRLYALGLARLVALGDVQAVAELADVITLSALAHGAGEEELADAIWMAGARAIGWGSSPEHEHAKVLVRAGSPAALAAMRAASRG